jgi:hypothetical protein
VKLRPRRVATLFAACALTTSGLFFAGVPSALALPSSPCTTGSTPAVHTVVTCDVPGSYTLTVPPGTTSVDLDAVGAGGGAGYPANSHIGGNAAEVTGTLTLPLNTAFLYVIVGSGGTGGNSDAATGGDGSAVFAEDAGHALIRKLAIAGGGGGGAYDGNGGNAGSAGTSDNFDPEAVSSPGGGAVGAVGGIGGAGDLPGTAGSNDSPTSANVALGGIGGANPSGGHGGGGGGGYGGGGGGGASNDDFIDTNQAGGGGGSSLVSSYLAGPSVVVAPGTGGIQLPSAGDGASGTVTLTFEGVAVPGAPTNASAVAGDQGASVSFDAPASDGGSPITGYTVTASPGSAATPCSASPCTVTGLTNGTAYTFTVHATNVNGDSDESLASDAVTPASAPDAPTGVSATSSPGHASVSFTVPASDGGSPITGYTVTASPGSAATPCAASPCAVAGLTNGTAYTFTVHATSSAGSSVESDPSSAVTPVSVPGAPTGAVATVGDGQASVSFTAPASDGGSAILEYKVTSIPDGDSDICATSPCIVFGLANGTPYTFTVHATNSVGNSVESTPTSSVVPAAVPDAPTAVSATAGNGQASVTFVVPVSDGGSAVLSYTVTSSSSSTTATCPGSPCVITGLTNGTADTFTVHATNAIGNSTESVATTSITPVGPASAPTGVSLTPGNGEAVMAFLPPDNGGGAIIGYEYSLDDGDTWHALSVSSLTPVVVGTISGLVNGTTYQVEFRAQNSAGPGAASAPFAVTPATVPAPPTEVAAARGNTQASISFVAPADSGGVAVTSYTVTSAPDGHFVVCTSSPCTVSGLTNGTSYTFTVVATNAHGDSASSIASNAVTPATVPGTPSSVSVTGGNSSALVSFTAPSDTGGSPVTGYEYSTDGGDSWHPLTTSGTAPVTGTITGLVNGALYSIEVRAFNSVGVGIGSIAAPTTASTTPSPPTAVVAIATAGRATVSFTPSAADGGLTITSYTATSSPGGITVSCAASPCVVTGLTNGAAYTFTVHATNADGNSAESSPSGSVTPISVAGAPGNVTTTATDTALTVSFTVPDNGGSTITGYQVSTDNGATWVALVTTGSGSVLGGTVTGLRAGTSYQVLVRAINTVGAGSASAAVSITTRPAATAAPTATAGTSSATISWTQSTTSTVTGYTVYASPGSATCTTDSIADTSCVIGATAGVAYTYTVVAHSPAGDSIASASSSATTVAAPAAPSAAPTDAPTTLTTTDGVLTTVTPGQQITVIGTGFLPNSSVTIIVYSAPIVLGSAVTDAAGDFSVPITIPTTLDVGAHNIVASGVDPSGAVRFIRMAVTVSAASTPGSTSTSTDTGTGAVTSSGSLPFTGTPALQLGVGGLVIIAVGTLSVASARRRRPSRR